eukprot:171776-Lingulodinium_polyedra.AAC.1
MRSYARFAASARRNAPRARAMKWCARGAYVRGAFRRAEAAKRAFDRRVTQRFAIRCATMRSNPRFVVLARRSALRTRAPCARHEMVR